MPHVPGRRRSRVAAVLVSLLALGAWASPTSAAPTAPATSSTVTAVPARDVPPSRWLVGGCLIAFSAAGRPEVRPSPEKPCVGVRSVSVDQIGDLAVHLTAEESAPAISLQATAGTTMVRRGIVVGVSGGGSLVSIRMYDHQRRTRVNLASTTGRARAAGTNLHVGWTKAGGYGSAPEPTTVDPGYNRLGRHRDLAAPPLSTVRGGCAVRFNRAGPWVHANAAHRCVGVSRVGITGTGRLEIWMTPQQRAAVLNVQADPDETLTTAGITAGVSISGSQLIIDLYDQRLRRVLDLRRSGDRARIAGSYSNMWLSWTKTTTRPGSPRASTDLAPHGFGRYLYGSSTPDEVMLHGCTVRIRASSRAPQIAHGTGRLCTGVTSAAIQTNGDLQVNRSIAVTETVLATTSLTSRTLTDHGIRVGLSGGAARSSYRFWSMRDGRRLNLNVPADRALLERSGAELVLGWSHPLVTA